MRKENYLSAYMIYAHTIQLSRHSFNEDCYLNLNASRPLQIQRGQLLQYLLIGQIARTSVGRKDGFICVDEKVNPNSKDPFSIYVSQTDVKQNDTKSGNDRKVERWRHDVLAVDCSLKNIDAIG